MSDEDDLDPNAGVPLWVNVLVPIVTGILFLAVLVILFHTNKEIPVEKLEDWVEKIPLLNKWLSTEFTVSEEEASTKVKAANKSNLNTSEKSSIRRHSSMLNIRRYDSISTIRTHNDTVSDSESQRTDKKQYFYASQGTLISFESSV